MRGTIEGAIQARPQGLERRHVMTYRKLLSMSAAVALAAGGLVITAPSASAKDRPVLVVAPSDPAPTRRVSYADLNLASVAGETTLNRRVRGAVSSVCREAVGPSPALFANQACSKFAWAGARPQIARAVQRAHDIATTGSSTIAATAITIVHPK